MIVLAFSDSHGSTYSIDAAMEREQTVNAIVFCGDIARDADYIRTRYPNIPLYAVRGNNDYFCDDPYLLIPELAGVRVYVTHGHRERVKFGYHELVSQCRQKACRLCIFGHTHIPVSEEHDGVYLINPGSIRSSRGTYARIELADCAFHTEIRCVAE